MKKSQFHYLHTARVTQIQFKLDKNNNRVRICNPHWFMLLVVVVNKYYYYYYYYFL